VHEGGATNRAVGQTLGVAVGVPRSAAAEPRHRRLQARTDAVSVPSAVPVRARHWMPEESRRVRSMTIVYGRVPRAPSSGIRRLLCPPASASSDHRRSVRAPILLVLLLRARVEHLHTCRRRYTYDGSRFALDARSSPASASGDARAFSGCPPSSPESRRRGAFARRPRVLRLQRRHPARLSTIAARPGIGSCGTSCAASFVLDTLL